MLRLVRAIVIGLVAMVSIELQAGQRLVLFGGGNMPREGMVRLVDWAGGSDARLLVISWASSYEPAEILADFRTELGALAPRTIEVAPAVAEMSTRREEFLRQLAGATGVFFSGGDQVRVMDVLSDRGLLEALRARYAQGIVFSGTSAGTAIMSQTMLTGEGDFTVIDARAVETRAGLGLLPHVVVDQHFIKRQRLNRLLSVLTASQERIGLGVDEDACVAVQDGVAAEVLGVAKAILIRRPAPPASFAIDVLGQGERFSLAD
jgi:cyanophycinase